MERHTERVTLHFDLSNCPQDIEFTLNAGGRKHKLTSYSQAPHKMVEHRRKNKALALIPESYLGRITHFVEDAELYSDAPALRSVTFPSQDDHPLPELAAVFFHIPPQQRRHAFSHMRALGVKLRHEATLAHYGVPHATLLAAAQTSPAQEDEIRADAGSIVGPTSSAQTIVFHHPEIGTCNPLVAQQVFSAHVQYSPEFSALVQYISGHGGVQPSWYQKTYTQWQDPDTGQWGNMPADTDSVGKDGKKPAWPIVNGQAVIPQYSLTSDVNSGDTGVLGAASPVVLQVLIDTKNDNTLNGQLWTKQSGTTQKTQTNVSPSPKPKAALAAGAGGGVKGFAIKNQTSSYGLDVYPDQLTYDSTTSTLTFPVKNWPSRYLVAYVQFFKSDGTAINRSDIPNWNDNLPDFLQGMFEADPTKNYVTYLSSGNAVFGIPFPTNPTTLEFIYPQAATTANVLVGGLGCASGFTDWDTDVDLGGTMATGLVCYGITALSMAFTVYVVNPIMSMLSGTVLYAIYGIGALIGVAGVIGGAIEYKTSAGKMILAKLSNMVAGIVFGQIVKLALKQAYKDAIAEMIAEMWSLITADEALEQIPFAGWALQVASVAGDIAALAATTIECLASPATYQLQVLHTLDLTATVSPDPKHGKQGQNPIWPLVSDHYVITVKYPGSNGQEGGTTYVAAGPMPGDHTAPIVVPFNQIPAGGKLEVVANIYSSNNWLAGQWASGWVDATPDANDNLAVSGNITEFLVPLTATTAYSQKQRVIYDSTAQQHLWQVTQFSIDASLSTDLDAKDASPAVRSAFSSNGNNLSNQVAITVDAQGSSWTLVDSTAAITFQIQKVTVYSSDNQQLYELQVQNQTNASPQLPTTLHDCTTDGDGHNVCERVNIIINNKEYELGYTWKASGQNMPLDNGTTNSNDQMYAFQSISTLGEPQNQIIQPARGFTQRTFLGFDQFGLSAVLQLPTSMVPELNAGGPVPSDIQQAFAGFGLPQNSQITVATPGQRWLLGVAGSDPVFDLRLETVAGTAQQAETALVASAGSAHARFLAAPSTQQIVNAYSYPVPALDNFWLDPRTFATDGLYHLRGVTFPPGASTFDYTEGQSWGAFTQQQLNAFAVHPQGYVVAVDFETHKMFVLKLPAQAVAEADAPLAMPLSGEGLREGLMNEPVAMTITADGRILVLEQGNRRIQAFDVKGNPVPSFNGPIQFPLTADLAAAFDSKTPNAELSQQYQQHVTPATAPVFSSNPSSASSLDQGVADATLVAAFHTFGYDLPADTTQIAIATTTAGSLWFLADNSKNETYDIRLVSDNIGVQHLFVYRAAVFQIDVKAPGLEWLLSDLANAMTYDVNKPATGGALTAQQLVSTMALRDQSPSTVNYLDIAVENKGYIYVLASVLQPAGPPVFQLDIYNPDGTVLLTSPQTGVNAERLTVDQWRTLFTLTFERVLGPGLRTEPGVSAWIPSTPGSPTGAN